MCVLFTMVSCVLELRRIRKNVYTQNANLNSLNLPSVEVNDFNSISSDVIERRKDFDERIAALQEEISSTKSELLHPKLYNLPPEPYKPIYPDKEEYAK